MTSQQQQQPHTRTPSVPYTISTNTISTSSSSSSSSNPSPVHSRNASHPIFPTKSPGSSPTFSRSSRPSLNLATPPPQPFPSRFPRSTATTPNQTTDSPSDYFQSPGASTPYTPSTPESGTSLRRSGAIGHSRSSSRSSIRARRDSSLQSSRTNSLTASAAFPPSAPAIASAAAASSAVKRQSSAAFPASASASVNPNTTASRSSSTGSSVSSNNLSTQQRIRTTAQSANAQPPSSVMAAPTPHSPSQGSQEDARATPSTSALPPPLPPSMTESKDSPHSQRPSPDSPQMPDVPRRRSSVHRLRRKGSSPKDTSAPQSPLPSPRFQQQEDLQTDSPATALTPSQSTTADSSDLSDYGSQADEDEVYQDNPQRRQQQQQISRSGSTDATATMETDLSDAIKLAGGPPKLQRRQRDASRAPAGSSSSANQTATSPNSSTPPSSEQPSFDSQPTTRARRSQSPRKLRTSPSEQAGSPATPGVEATPLARDAPLPADAALPPPGSLTKSRQSPDTAGTPSQTNADDAALEAEAQRLADLENPDRPKTLKEARELAKARAQARKVQPSVALSPGATTSTSSTSRPALQPSQSNTSVMDELQAAVGDALQDLSFGSTISDNSDTNPASSRGLAPDAPGTGSGTTTSQSTTGLARSRETSFDSARSFAEQETAAAIDNGRLADPVPSAAPIVRLPQSESARTIRTDQAQPSASGLESGLTLGEALDMSAPDTPRLADASDTNARAIPSYPAGSHEKSPMANYRLAQSPLSGPQVQPRSSSNAPPQRTLISLNTRIDVPGKTVPYPPAMNAQSVSIDKRKLPPWERARAYATFVNELANMPSGLTTWMEMAQRQPRNTVGTARAGGQRGGGPRYPSTFGGGGESGTYTGDSAMMSLSSGAYVHPRDASGASVRSDMTFPMRGDGGRARDVTQVPFDRNAPDSMPDAVPSNIPYPTLVHQQQHSNQSSLSSRTGSYTSAAASPYGLGGSTPGSTPTNSSGRMGGLRARKVSNSALDALGPLLGGSGAGTNASPVNPQTVASATPLSIRSGLLSSLGRRGSKRNATVHPSMSSANSSGSVSGPRGPRTAGTRLGGAGAGRSATMNTAGGNISGPYYSSPSSSSVIDLGAMAKDPDQAGLGLGLTRSPGEETSPGRGAGGNGLRHAKSNAMLSPDGGPSASNGHSFRGGPQQTSPSLSAGPRQGSGAGTDHGTRGGFLAAVGSASSSRKNSASSADGGNSNNNEAFKNALQRVSDVLPDAEEETLVGYLKRAHGDDLKAIGDYLNDQALGNIKRH